MAQIRKKLRYYKALTYSGTFFHYRSQIMGLDDRRKGVLMANFYDDGIAIPENKILDNGIIVLNHILSEYNKVLDLLRNEKPIDVCYDEEHKAGWIETNYEPVGENEPVNIRRPEPA